MKSRFLASTTVVLALLLGLVSSNLLAQISDASSVDFQLRTYSRTGVATGSWQTASTGVDTVGRKAEYLVKFTAAQPLTSADYTVTFPAGTVLNSTVADSIYIQYLSEGLTTQFKVDPSRITIITQNDTTGYSATVRPVVRITDVNTWGAAKVVSIYFYKGIWLSKVVASANQATAVSSQKRMKVSLNHSITVDGSYTDSTSFYVENDLAHSVRFNTTIAGFIDNGFFPNSDSLVILDRFGNLVPDFLDAAAFGDYKDTVQISVPSKTTVGQFKPVPQFATVNAFTNNIIKLNADSSAIMFLGRAVGVGGFAPNLANTGAYNNDALFQNLLGASNDNESVITFLGEDGGTGAAASAGLKFDAVSGVDTVQFTVTLKGTRVSSGKVLDVTATNVSRVTRNVLAATASKTIGSLALSFTPSAATYNGLPIGSGGAFTITLKNVFGDAFNGVTIGGANTDSVRFIFKYRRQGVVNAAMTTLLQQGGQVTSQYTRPASRLQTGTMGSGAFTNISSGEYGSKLTGATLTAGVANLAGSLYFGTTSHPQRDSIYVVAYAWNNPTVRDSFLVNVEPSPPIAFDLDTLTVNLAAAQAANQIIRGATIPYDLPIFALDTAYNRVSNLNLNNAGTSLGSFSNQSDNLPMINLLVDGRDPLGYNSVTVMDSIRLDSTSIGARTGLNAAALADSSFISHYNYARADSSRLNFGSIGNAKMGLRLGYLGVRRLTIKWAPGTGPAAAYSSNAVVANVTRQLDLGLFNLQSETLIDSVTNVQVVAAAQDTVGERLARVVRFDIATGNELGPNQADSVIFIAFNNLPAGAGIPAGISKDSVRISADGGVTYYAALNVDQVDDSIAVAVPLNLGAGTAYVRIHGFINPTRSDSSYGVRVSTEANLTVAKKNAAWTVNDGAIGSIKLTSVQSSSTNPQRDDRDSTLAVVTAAGSRTVKAGDATFLRIVFADRFGNILENAASFGRSIVIRSADSTSTGKSLVASQIYNGATTSSTGINMYDTLTVTTDSLTVSTTPYYFYGDSVRLIPAKVGSYYVLFTDRLMPSAKDSVLLTVTGTQSGSIVVASPLGKQTTAKGGSLDSAFTVTLRDTMGNALADSVVTFAVISGAGTFVDSQGVAVAVPNDTLNVRTNALGQAVVRLKAGTTDSIAVAVYNSNSAVARKYFSAVTTTVINLPTTFVFTTKPDSLVPDTAGTQSVVVSAKDGNGVKSVSLTTYSTALVLGTDGKFTLAATTDTVTSVQTVTGTPDSTAVTFSVAKKALATYVQYKATIVDGNDSTATSATQLYVVAPKRGKSKLSTDPTNVSDIMRLVYLVLEFATPSAIDYLGLDLNQDGQFTGDADLVQILNIWRGTSTLAAAGEQQLTSAKVALSIKAVDKASANLFIDLENKGDVTFAQFQVKYDAEKYSFGEVARTERVGSNIQVLYNDKKAEGILNIIVLNLEGRSISSGTGAILSIPVQALNGKFDGTGEISLLSAGFGDVQTELNKEALSPKALLPKAFALGQNFPNPFNPSTTIAYDIPEGNEVQVRLNIYNIRGQLVRTLVDESKNEGSYQIQWNGDNNNGQKVSSGVYFYRLQAGDFNQTRKMVILK